MENDNYGTPLRFEYEFPEEAAFMMRIFAAGGKFEQPRFGEVPHFIAPGLPPISQVRRNEKCPCNSGRKAKNCHPAWTAKHHNFLKI